jgi:hypothetical protein
MSKHLFQFVSIMKKISRRVLLLFLRKSNFLLQGSGLIILERLQIYLGRERERFIGEEFIDQRREIRKHPCNSSVCYHPTTADLPNLISDIVSGKIQRENILRRKQMFDVCWRNFLCKHDLIGFDRECLVGWCKKWAKSCKSFNDFG